MSLTSKELLSKAAKVLNGRKAEDISAIDIGGVSILADYFLLASGGSSTQVKSLAEELEFKLSQEGIEPLRVEGSQSGTWIIVDYGQIVVHVFHRETREFYNLERLWADGRKMELSEILGEESDKKERKSTTDD